MGLEDFGESPQENSLVKFGETLDLEGLESLINYIGNSPDYDIRWGYQVEHSKVKAPKNGGHSKISRRTIGKITGQVLLQSIVSVDFECLEEPNREEGIRYSGIQFSTFDSNYHPKERSTTWSRVRESVQNYFNLIDQDAAFNGG